MLIVAFLGQDLTERFKVGEIGTGGACRDLAVVPLGAVAPADTGGPIGAVVEAAWF